MTCCQQTNRIDWVMTGKKACTSCALLLKDTFRIPESLKVYGDPIVDIPMTTPGKIVTITG
ncbi:MAG TPA: hypothetical protein VFU05_20480 [Cyclobacteriaceae bacterium]|nr:hypothetical protein [Cyclobacteriaceae bacterium]